MSPLPIDRAAANRRLALRLGVVAVLSMGFGFALAPLYDVFCQMAGVNTKAERFAARPVGVKVDRNRWVTVEFMGQPMPGLPVVFRPSQDHLRINPGEIVLAKYLVRNPTNQTLLGQAVPSISPGNAGQHFKKIDCFCFREQTLAPGEEREMAVTFWVAPELPRGVTDITLSYAFYSSVKKG
jgi:cytochrome c oxidase assembly protein subunit 11